MIYRPAFPLALSGRLKYRPMVESPVPGLNRDASMLRSDLNKVPVTNRPDVTSRQGRTIRRNSGHLVVEARQAAHLYQQDVIDLAKVEENG
jgi:hypothetical protein